MSAATTSVTAFAPATVANVAVGFDILGFALPEIGDRATVRKTNDLQITLTAITGHPDSSQLPTDPQLNVATIGLFQLQKDLQLNFGFEVSIQKGIPLSSGLGGSAASAVAALVAANALLPKPLSAEQLIPYALLGEKLASGTAHPDNVVPCLLGGLTLTSSKDPLTVTSIPVPSPLFCVLVHPHMKLDTQKSRAVLKAEIPMAQVVAQNTAIAAFIAACYTNNLTLLKSSLKDHIVEPQRATLIPGFHAVQKSAYQHQAIGCSISGSGPSIFAWFSEKASAHAASVEMRQTFLDAGQSGADAWVFPLSKQGARVIS